MYDLLRPCTYDSFDELHCFHSTTRQSTNLDKFDDTVISTADNTTSSSARRQDNVDHQTNILVPRATRPPHESAYGSPRINRPNASFFNSPSHTRTRYPQIHPIGPYQDPPSPNQGGMGASYGAPSSTTTANSMSTTTPSEPATLGSGMIPNESATLEASVAAEVTTVTTADTLTTTVALEAASSTTSATSTSNGLISPALTTEMVVLSLEGDLVTFGSVTRAVSERSSETSDTPQGKFDLSNFDTSSFVSMVQSHVSSLCSRSPSRSCRLRTSSSSSSGSSSSPASESTSMVSSASLTETVDSATPETTPASQASGPEATTLTPVPSTTPMPTTSTDTTNLTDASSGTFSEAGSNGDTTSSSWPAAKVLGPTITLCLLGLIAFFAFLVYRQRRNRKRMEEDVVGKAEWYGFGPAPDQSLGHNGNGSSLTRGSSRQINTGLDTWNEQGGPRTSAGATASNKTRPPSIADIYASDGIKPYWGRSDFGIRMREKMMEVDESKTAPLPTALPTITPTPMSWSRDSGVGLSTDTRHEHDHDHDISMPTNTSASTSGSGSVAITRTSNATTDPHHHHHQHHHQRRLSALSEKTEKTDSSAKSVGISTTSNSMDLIERELDAPRRISPPKSPARENLRSGLPALPPTQSQHQHVTTYPDLGGGGSSPVTPTTTTMTSSLLPNPPSTPRSISTTSMALRALRDSECDGGIGWRLYRGSAEVRPYVAAGRYSERDGHGHGDCEGESEGEGEGGGGGGVGGSRTVGRRNGDRGSWKGKGRLMGRAMGSLCARLKV